MSSDDRPDAAAPHDVGLLSPVSILVADAVSDAAVAERMVAAELALLRAYVAEGHAPASVGAAADAVPVAIELSALARDAVPGGNPVIPLVALLRRQVAAVDADAAGWVHRGATSQDILDTALMLLCRDVAAAIEQQLARAIAATAALAERHRDDPAAARTLTQHAVPTTLGLKAALWTRGLMRARVELARVAATLPAQLGGAGGTLAAIAERIGADAALELPRAYARELGLAAPASVWHTDRAPVTAIGAALAGVVSAAGALASDVAQLARTEVGEASPASGGGSSTMPQKANPVDAVLVRSAALRAPSLLATLQLAAGLAVDERPDGAWHAEWPTLQELLRLTLGTAERTAALAEGLVLHPERARANLDATAGAILSERLAIHLTPLIGRERFDALVADAAGGALRARVAALPEAAELDLDALFDPSRYLGVAGRATDEIVREARDGGAAVSVPAITLSAPLGPAGAPLVVLGASLGTSSILWEDVVPVLAARYRVLSWDLPGHGASPVATAPFTVADLADAVAAAVDEPAFAYAGVSLGGAVGLELALRHPARLSCAVIIASGARLGEPAAWNERAAQVRAQSTSSLITASASRWFAPGSIERRPELSGRLLHALQDADDESYARCCEALAQHDVRARLAEIAVPTLAVWGEYDTVSPEPLAAEIAERVQRGRTRRIADAGHLPPAEQPEATAAALLEYVEEAR